MGAAPDFYLHEPAVTPSSADGLSSRIHYPSGSPRESNGLNSRIHYPSGFQAAGLHADLEDVSRVRDFLGNPCKSPTSTTAQSSSRGFPVPAASDRQVSPTNALHTQMSSNASLQASLGLRSKLFRRNLAEQS